MNNNNLHFLAFSNLYRIIFYYYLQWLIFSISSIKLFSMNDYNSIFHSFSFSAEFLSAASQFSLLFNLLASSFLNRRLLVLLFLPCRFEVLSSQVRLVCLLPRSDGSFNCVSPISEMFSFFRTSESPHLDFQHRYFVSRSFLQSF